MSASEQGRELVKVIIPCYRYANYLADCVESVLRQEGAEVRVLIIDDCSPDETPLVARQIMRADERVEYRRHRQNVGLIKTANEGLEWAEDGDYVVLLSADDRLVPGALMRAVSVMRSYPRVGLVYGHAQHFESDHALPRIRKRWRGTRVWSGEDWIRLRCRSGHSCIASPEAVVRTSVQRQVGGYDSACQHTSDVNMWLRIAAVSDIAFVKGAAQALYRRHSDSMLQSMLNSDAGSIVDLTERRAAFLRFFASAGAQLGDAEELHAVLARTLARQALWKASRAYDRAKVHGSDAVPVEDLIAFAQETYPDTQHLREWWGLQLRMRIGAGRSLWFLPFVATGAGHRLRANLDRRRVFLRGV
jgi:glycosyltransferase involved in cell wall biosynthesis